MWITLYIVQTILGTIWWKREVFKNQDSYSVSIYSLSLVFSAFLIPNLSMIFAYFCNFLNSLENDNIHIFNTNRSRNIFVEKI